MLDNIFKYLIAIFALFIALRLVLKINLLNFDYFLIVLIVIAVLTLFLKRIDYKI